MRYFYYFIRVVVSCMVAAAVVVAAEPGVSMDSKAIDARHKSLEIEWRPTEKAATSYFVGVQSLLRQASAARSGLDDQELSIATSALQKDVATVQSSNRSALYDAQGEIATWMLTITVARVDKAAQAELRRKTADTALAYLRTLQSRLQEVATSERPVTNVIPPMNTGGPIFPGMKPSQIKDPEARQAYEAAIAANEKLAGAVREQASLRGIIDRLTALSQK